MKADVLWARQYSKRLITFLLVSWVIGGVVGIIYEFVRLITAPDMATMDSLYIYLAVPLTCGIPSYLIPNMFLNREKVRQNYIPDYDVRYLGSEGMGGEGLGINSESETEEISDTGLYADHETFPGEPGYPNLCNSGRTSGRSGAYGNGMEGIPDEGA